MQLSDYCIHFTPCQNLRLSNYSCDLSFLSIFLLFISSAFSVSNAVSPLPTCRSKTPANDAPILTSTLKISFRSLQVTWEIYGFLFFPSPYRHLSLPSKLNNSLSLILSSTNFVFPFPCGFTILIIIERNLFL